MQVLVLFSHTKTAHPAPSTKIYQAIDKVLSGGLKIPKEDHRCERIEP